MLSRLTKKLSGIVAGKQTPAANGVAGADWYDAAYRSVGAYAIPYWQSHYYFLWSVIADRIRSARLRRVLDIGCGPGQLAACLFEMAEIEAYVGLDFSNQAIAMARQACPRGQFVVGDARTTSIHAEAAHDVVVCTEVLEHLPEDLEVVKSFTPRKRCLCTVPNFPWESHVRHFKSAEQVAARYAPYFDGLDVHAMRVSEPNVFFLMDGVRNAFGRE